MDKSRPAAASPGMTEHDDMTATYGAKAVLDALDGE
ncbi:hypothetical protein JOC55_002945 [Paenibacillus sacheonensis]|nr:hypothetical protein [Paenibacillus sacheonensis]